MTQHYLGGLMPLRGLCGKKVNEVVLTSDLRRITCGACKKLLLKQRHAKRCPLPVPPVGGDWPDLPGGDGEVNDESL